MTDFGFTFEQRDDCICGVALPADASVIAKPVSRGTVTFRRCGACGSWIQSPRLTTAALALWYDSPEYQGGQGRRGIGYADYERDEPQRRHEAMLRYARDLAPHLPKAARVYEIGCASGSLLAEVASHGHHAAGCDLSERFAEMARRFHGLDIEVADWLDTTVPAASLDAVLLLGTISNLVRLDRCLALARSRLKPGGFIFFNFPAADGLPARLYGRGFWMFTPSVMQLMSRPGAVRALQRAGFALSAMTVDRQAPSLAKLLGHGRVGPIMPIFDRLGLLECRLPFALPLPGIYGARAVPA